MNRTVINSEAGPSTQGRYAQAIGIANATEVVYVSGQIGAHPDGTVGETFEEQCRLAWTNLAAQLAESGFSLQDLVKATVIMTDRSNVELYRSIRAEMLGDHQVAMTAIIAELLDERWMIELEGIAAR